MNTNSNEKAAIKINLRNIRFIYQAYNLISEARTVPWITFALLSFLLSVIIFIISLSWPQNFLGIEEDGLKDFLGIISALFGILALDGIINKVRIRHRFYGSLGRSVTKARSFMASMGLSYANDQNRDIVMQSEGLEGAVFRKGLIFRNNLDDNHVKYFTYINLIAFRTTLFSNGFPQKYNRNKRISQKNGLANALISCRGIEKYFGISAIFPLKDGAIEAYISRKIQDNAFDVDLIPTVQEHPGSLLIFSVGIRPLIRLLPQTNTVQFGECIMIAKMYHIYEIMKHYKLKEIDVYVAANDEDVVNMFCNFGFYPMYNNGEPVINGDGLNLYKANVRIAD